MCGQSTGDAARLRRSFAGLRRGRDICMGARRAGGYPQKMAMGRGRAPGRGRRRAATAGADRSGGNAGCGRASTVTSAWPPWCNAAGRWGSGSTLRPCRYARAACTPRSSDARARHRIPPGPDRGDARARAGCTSGARAARPVPAAVTRPPRNPFFGRALSVCPGYRTLAALTRLGSQTGSQRWQASGHVRRQPATVSPARWPIRPHPATYSDAADAPEKRKVGGSTPPLTTIRSSRLTCAYLHVWV